jgi:hypothetical protein
VLPVEVLPAPGGNLILRARGSELLIITNHVVELKSKREPKQFTEYFMGEALINRPARKLFEAWLRKDRGLWRRIYDCVQTIDTSGDDIAALKEEIKAKSGKAKSEPKAEAAPVAKPKAEAKPAKDSDDTGKAKAAKKPAKKEAEPEKAKAPAKKAETKPAKAAAKPAKPAAKPAAKKTAEKKTAAAKKPAAKTAAATKAKAKKK